jgi:hypothetical protein
MVSVYAMAASWKTIVRWRCLFSGSLFAGNPVRTPEARKTPPHAINIQRGSLIPASSIKGQPV